MFKAAYRSFLGALLATPVHLAAGNAETRFVVLALLVPSALFSAIGGQHRA